MGAIVPAGRESGAAGKQGHGSEISRHLTIAGLHVHVGLDEGHPLLDERAQLVPGKVKAVEVRHHIVALHVLAAELDLPEPLVVVLVEVGERDLEDAALQALRGDFGARSPGDKGLARIFVHEDGGRLNSVPLLLVEGILGLLLAALLRLCETLVLAWGRGERVQPTWGDASWMIRRGAEGAGSTER